MADKIALFLPQSLYGFDFPLIFLRKLYLTANVYKKVLLFTIQIQSIKNNN